MKSLTLNLMRVAVILGATTVTLYAAAHNWKTLGLLFAGLIFRDFFSSRVYDPIFKEQSAQGWAFGEIKKLATRKQPAQKLDV